MGLLQKQMIFSQLVSRFIKELREHLDIYVTLGEAYRTREQAELYVKQGLGILNSLHCQRLAVDLNLFYAEKLLSTVDEMREAGELWESYGIREYQTTWGGRFRRPDANHFSLEYDGIK